MLALWPTVSRALTLSGSASPWAEVCSAADESGSKAPASGAHADHCPLCSHGVSDPTLPPAPVVSERAMRNGASFVPVLFAQARSTLFAYARAQPRAPPVIA